MRHKTWVQTTIDAMDKAQALQDNDGLVPRRDGADAWTVPSATLDGAEHKVFTVVRSKGQPVQFWCDCREQYGVNAPVGWVACWHGGSVLRTLLEAGEIDLEDAQNGFVALVERTPTAPAETPADPFAGLDR